MERKNTERWRYSVPKSSEQLIKRDKSNDIISICKARKGGGQYMNTINASNLKFPLIYDRFPLIEIRLRVFQKQLLNFPRSNDRL
jgi:hypothetical protein